MPRQTFRKNTFSPAMLKLSKTAAGSCLEEQLSCFCDLPSHQEDSQKIIPNFSGGLAFLTGQHLALSDHYWHPCKDFD